MAILVALEHSTRYHFDRAVAVGPHVVRLRPAPHCRTPVSAYSLTVAPSKHFLNWQQDMFGNYLARLVFPETTTELTITVDLIADLTAINPLDFFVEESARSFPLTYAPALAEDLQPYLQRVQGPGLDAWVQALPPAQDQPIITFLAELNGRIAREVAYSLRLEAGVRSPDETLALGVGSCRDSAWLLVAALRRLGIAARFVSGYLVQLRPDVAAGQELDGPTADFTDLHAWAEAYLPGAGWVGMDATSGLFAAEGHLPLSATPHPTESAPVSGTTGAATARLTFGNAVRRLREDPRVTAPYTPQQWEKVLALGVRVDAALAAGDVRLTMGGEPTFVATDDMEADEWRIDADGPDKRARASQLATRLREKYAPTGLVHRGQGKWYPGEELPRWQIVLTWMRDGTPLWQDATLLGDPWGPPSVKPESGQNTKELILAIAEGLRLPTEYVLTAWEDGLHEMWEQASLPEGEEPSTEADPADLATSAARQAAAARLSAGAPAPAGWVLPLFASDQTGGWATTTWRTRRGALYLLPGTSPIGLRLPLDSLGWQPAPARPQASPFAEPGPLEGLPAGVVELDEDVPRTALCVQEREGHLFVFLPPIEELKQGLDLVRAIERAAAAIKQPVVLEGYPLPGDARTQSLSVTPDPGVVEVNVQPAAGWDELVEINHTLTLLAQQGKLGTEKFALDGTHTGTGGGSHLTLGGVRPKDSPLLRRPDLLVSLLTYWQHHPSLSYLFSGAFIGPTSQAPRVDEARHESLYELEIAFAELAALADPRPWQVDRALRHLLTDLTGNTHRSEFCIDKLFSPDSERGRLGLLELRSFEMAPHPQMALVQALLVRALVARFWDEPYRGGLIRWGTELHDRFLLPEPVAADIREVTADLRAHGFAFSDTLIEPFLEFRFPRLGQVQIAGVDLELRAAIEPWHVLGEQVTGAGTARYVDSSLEKVQVTVTGATADRHLVTCNGVPVPLRPTAVNGTFVAGVRYRAWQPWSAMHPTIKVHAPLVFDVIDRWNARSLGGCTYHVVHPGGRAYKRFPVNAAEAESRRTSRFTPHGHTPGPVDITSLDSHAFASPEYPHTLDLRRSKTGS